ncbi:MULTISPECIES: PTS sugar transporter subunit IIA [Pelosinus]|uniref:Phosphoenolpyruvate-dependent sugar phosphotransferase system EIIA 2 n=1 Tax=Pelosinus fermentans B4 TaxID=1149862 RepID=I9AXX7_9FIRM|nr:MULTISPECIES: PTS sugar transporter subunit IIA [Pelosinus]EIW17752.1 phosphoenolpyruvate-dependent sugar phosphotransferase system EIIA 2 [Pelosinus fermentans B4]EIW23714.1 putative PTS IIA-like nitrogen-regulatory protein PtsN [Pelosinus fermentans A11]OAM94638.1 putative PTS IIA-like nitrogen-regulatory protein PtsN [Pelosinus fermentans DSM 17108]SDR14222.1 PTS system, fructose-specific IIA component [Pelosinus fermentans]
MIIHESLIELHMKSKSKMEIIETLAHKAKELSCISEVEGYLKDVFALDESLPIAFGYGIAIPYGKGRYVLTPFIAFARSEEAFTWDHRVDHEARLIFLIGIPEEQDDDFDFQMLTHMSGGLTNESFRRRFLQTSDAAEVVELFKEMGL